MIRTRLLGLVVLVSSALAGTVAGSTHSSLSAFAAAGKPAAVCGRLTEIADDHVTIKPDSGQPQRITVGDHTDFRARSYHAARTGLAEGDYARATGGTDGSTATRLEWGEVDFCGHARPNKLLVGTVADSDPNSVTVQVGAAAIKVEYSQTTKFYVNGHLEQNPPAFKVGEPVRLQAHLEADGSYTALTVRVKTT